MQQNTELTKPVCNECGSELIDTNDTDGRHLWVCMNTKCQHVRLSIGCISTELAYDEVF
jgi:ssDNA-binding Zn-finger/Zn-ribbon topoisomerase 1